MDIKYKPLFITPFIYNDWNINSIINTTFLNSLSKSFLPSILCTKHSDCINNKLLRTNGNLMSRGIIRFLPHYIIKRLEQIPDIYYFFWYKSAIKIASAYIEEGNVNYLHSISIPYTSHLVAFELKKKYNLPWIAQFYEPWGDNPYRNLSRKIVSKNQAWEEKCVLSADAVIHNSELICDFWGQKYGAVVTDKMFSLPMPFEFNEELSPDFSASSDKLRISHIGNLYGLRRANTFVRALYELVKENSSIRTKIEVYFIGRMNSDDLSLIETYNLNDIIKVVGVLPEEDCKYYYFNSDVFLLIEAENQGPFFFPSKLIRYFYYNKPILALTNQNSVTAFELNNTGHYSLLPSDIKGIKAYLLKALIDYESLLDFDKSSWKRFDSRNVFYQYSKIVNQIVK